MRTLRITIIGMLTAILFVNLGLSAALSDRYQPEDLNKATQMMHPTPFAHRKGYAKNANSPQRVEPNPVVVPPEGIQLTLAAPNFTTSRDERDPDRKRFALPLLYLHRQRDASDPADRTLEIRIAGLEAGVEVEIQAVSRRADRSTGEPFVATTRFVSAERPCTSEQPCTLRWTLDATTTLSDFYYLRVKDKAGTLLWQSADDDRPDFVALDTWEVAIDDYTVRIYYATLFPFAKGEHDLKHRLVPGSVVDFIEYVFVPMILQTWQTQLHDWGFGDPIHPDWDRDNMVEIIITDPPFALFDGTGPYTVLIDGQRNPYPERRIWWPASCNNYYMYDLLPNGYKVMFAHEFFHLAQWNVLLTTGSPANFSPNLFLEAQAGIAASAQFPDIEIGGRHIVRDLGEERGANRFLTQRLNSSYRELEAESTDKYDVGLYWRFLFEQFNGMDVIRAALEEMPHYVGTDPVGSMMSIMDRALARVDGPFNSFEESLVRFARANYALRLENGRCTTADLTQCGGFYYDPKHVYVDPPLEARLRYDGQTLTEDGFLPASPEIEFAGFGSTDELGEAARVGRGHTYSGSIPASYGMDFIEIRLDPALHNQRLVVEFQAQGRVANFDVQIWRLGAGEIRPRALTGHPEAAIPGQDGLHVYTIPQVDATVYDRLALIITRLDADEAVDAEGGYTITLACR